MKPRRVQLNDICDITDGTHYTPPNSGGPFPFLTVKDMTDEGLSFSACSYISEAEFLKAKKVGACPEEGTVLFSKDGTVGKVHVVRDKRPFAVLSSIAILRPDKSQLDAEFLGFALQSAEISSDAQNRKTGSALRRIVLEDLKEVTIPMPDLSEQLRIAQRLNLVDRLRRTRRYTHQVRDTLLQSVFLELFGDPRTNPNGYPVHEIGEHIVFLTSGSRGWAQHYSEKGARFIRSLDVQMNELSDSDTVYVMPPANAEARRTQVHTGDVLLTITGSRIGRVAPVKPGVGEAYVSQHVAIIRIDAQLLPEYLSMFLSHHLGGQLQIATAQYGQSKPGLNLDQIREFKAPIPSLGDQLRFRCIVQKYERLKDVHLETHRQAEHLFLTFLHDAFSAQSGEANTRAAVS